VFAAGDVIGAPQLASTAIDQGRKAANQLLGQIDVPYQPIFPYGIYTYPEMSMVGKSEKQLQDAGIPYFVGVGRYRDTARGQIIGDTDGMLKLLFDPETRKILGVHAIGREATELIHIGQSVMIFGGVLDYFVDTVFNYPTLAEVYKIAALNGLNKVLEAQGKLAPMDVFGKKITKRNRTLETPPPENGNGHGNGNGKHIDGDSDKGPKARTVKVAKSKASA
jgi:NAD(P) transhydrogenase